MQPSQAGTRVCAVSFLNTLPLVWELQSHPQPDCELAFATPAECARRMRDGEADIGLVPVVEAQRQGLQLLPGVGIACRGAVRSILLISKVPFGEIQSLALDTSSRSSVMLVRSVLEERYGCRPRLSEAAPVVERMLESSDAALVIGDPALRFDPAATPHRVLDLGQAWWTMTGLPMVFAMWAARPGMADAERWSQRLTAAWELGMARMEEYVAAEAAKRGIAEDLAREYLRERIVYRIGPEEENGLARFLEYSRKKDQLPTP